MGEKHGPGKTVTKRGPFLMARVMIRNPAEFQGKKAQNKSARQQSRVIIEVVVPGDGGI